MSNLSMPCPGRRRRFGIRSGSVLLAAVVLTALGGSLAQATTIRSDQWPLDARHFQAERIWSISSGTGVTVAVVDSGVDASHPDLAGQVLPGIDEIDSAGDDGRMDSSADSHGTAIAGLIVGTGRSLGGQGVQGLAPGARILPVRVALGAEVSPTALANGVTWAADHGASVINVSIGIERPDPVLQKAVAYALRKDAVVVASAGNSGLVGNPKMYPASFPGVVSVAGTDENGEPWKSSEFGPGITLAAPATDILSTNDQGQYVTAGGTSYAAAYVSAAAALVRSHEPHLTAGQVIRRLISTTSPHYASPNSRLGAGELDPLAAVTSTTDPGAPGNPLPLVAARDSVTPQALISTPLAVGASAAGLVAVAAGGYWLVRRRKQIKPSARDRGGAPMSNRNRPAAPPPGRSARSQRHPHPRPHPTAKSR